VATTLETTVDQHATSWDVVPAFLHAVTSAALAGGLAGILAGGIGGRIAMRITAIMATSSEQGVLTEAEEHVGDITVEGTIALIVFGGLATGVVGGFVWAACRRWFEGLGRWRGPAFGVFLLATLGWAVIEGDNFDFSTFGAVSVNLAMFAAIYLAFGLLVVPLHDQVSRHLPRPSARPSFLLALPLYAIGLFFSLGLLLAIGGHAGDEEGVETLFYLIVPAYLILGLAIAGWLIARGAGGFARLDDLRGRRAPLAVAATMIVAPIALGLALDAQSLAEMLTDAY
jgi:hypothetical protein